MNWSNVVLVVAGVAAGFVAGRMLRSSTHPDAPIINAASEVREILQPPTVAIVPPDVADPRIVQLNGQIAELQKANAEKIRVASQDMAQRAIEQLKQDDSASLAAAGFSRQRVDWLKQRATELLAERERAEVESRSRDGSGDRQSRMDFLEASSDQDILLLPEIGEEEFARYRAALDKPIGVLVTAVPAGSNAERAGIKPGDEIMSYGGRRVISNAVLGMYSQQTPPAGSVPVEVLRDGKRMKISVPSGPVNVKAQWVSASF